MGIKDNLTVIGLALQAAGGNPPLDIAGAANFSKIPAALGEWLPKNLLAIPKSVADSGGVLGGIGGFLNNGDTNELGDLMATKLAAPTVPPQQMKTYWRKVAKAIVQQFEVAGQWIPTGMTTAVPLGGQGKIQFSTAIFVPPLAVSLGVSDPVAGVFLEAFGAALLAQLTLLAGVTAKGPALPFLGAAPNSAATGFGTVV